MKKLIGILFILCQIMCASCVSAANGDISGNIYSTDIKALINGVEVPSYNIGGKTVVILEDIFKDSYSLAYSDYYRTLKFFSLDPASLKPGNTKYSKTTGKIVGYTYETDIKTSIYGVEIPSYNIGGKTAVAIEDLGKDGEFSKIGGKYIWDAKNRIITLEFLYEETCSDVLRNYQADMHISINEDLSKGTVTFERKPLITGSATLYTWPDWFLTRDANMVIEKIIPLMAETESGEELIGYHFYLTEERTDWDPNNFRAFSYFYEEPLKRAVSIVEPEPVTREYVINVYTQNYLGNVIDRIDTDDYSFLFMGAGTSHGGTHYLLLVKEDGTFHDFSDDFESVSFWGTKTFENVKIDKENEKVYLHYDYDYEIDLKTGTLSKIN